MSDDSLVDRNGVLQLDFQQPTPGDLTVEQELDMYCSMAGGVSNIPLVFWEVCLILRFFL